MKSSCRISVSSSDPGVQACKQQVSLVEITKQAVFITERGAWDFLDEVTLYMSPLPACLEQSTDLLTTLPQLLLAFTA